MAKKATTTTELKDTLLDSIFSDLNKKFKDCDAPVFNLDNDDAPTNVKSFVSTGNDILDLVISNRPNGGLPSGRIVELFGLEGTSKSLVCAHVLSQTQKAGGTAVLIDTESSVDRNFYRAVGVDLGKLVYSQLNTIETIFKGVDTIIETVSNSNNDNKLVTIVVDSIAAAATDGELEEEYGMSGYGMERAKMLSIILRRITNVIAKKNILLIFTNQVRQKVGAKAFEEQYSTTGGLALRFYCSVRIKLTNAGKIKDAKSGEVIGNKVNAEVIKNRVGPPFRKCGYDIYFDSGIDNYGSWLLKLKERELIKQGGAWYNFDFNGEEIKFQSKDFLDILTNRPDVKQFLYGKLCESMIMVYKDKSVVRVDDGNIVEPEGE